MSDDAAFLWLVVRTAEAGSMRCRYPGMQPCACCEQRDEHQLVIEVLGAFIDGMAARRWADAKGLHTADYEVRQVLLDPALPPNQEPT